MHAAHTPRLCGAHNLPVRILCSKKVKENLPWPALGWRGRHQIVCAEASYVFLTCVSALLPASIVDPIVTRQAGARDWLRVPKRCRHAVRWSRLTPRPFSRMRQQQSMIIFVDVRAVRHLNGASVLDEASEGRAKR